MTEEQKKISRINQRKAREHFGILGRNDLILHHVDWTMKYNNVERYILWLPEDLVVMKVSEHTKLHWSLNHDDWCERLKGHGHPCSEETKRKIGEKNKGHRHTDETKKALSESLKGRKKGPMSDEHKQRISESKKGKHVNSGPTGKHWKLVDGNRIYY